MCLTSCWCHCLLAQLWHQRSQKKKSTAREIMSFVDQMNKCCCRLKQFELHRAAQLLLAWALTFMDNSWPGSHACFSLSLQEDQLGLSLLTLEQLESEEMLQKITQIAHQTWRWHEPYDIVTTAAPINRVISCYQTRVKYVSALKGQIHLNFRKFVGTKQKLRITF